jgi:hypothetical protein
MAEMNRDVEMLAAGMAVTRDIVQTRAVADVREERRRQAVTVAQSQKGRAAPETPIVPDEPPAEPATPGGAGHSVGAQPPPEARAEGLDFTVNETRGALRPDLQRTLSQLKSPERERPRGEKAAARGPSSHTVMRRKAQAAEEETGRRAVKGRERSLDAAVSGSSKRPKPSGRDKDSDEITLEEMLAPLDD